MIKYNSSILACKLKINNKNNTESKSIKINNSNTKTNIFK